MIQLESLGRKLAAFACLCLYFLQLAEQIKYPPTLMPLVWMARENFVTVFANAKAVEAFTSLGKQLRPRFWLGLLSLHPFGECGGLDIVRYFNVRDGFFEQAVDDG